MRNLEKRIERLENESGPNFTETAPSNMSDEQLIWIATGSRRAPGDVADMELMVIANGV